ncbi:hypothetical protein BDR03DRAFT_1019390 [Suillus americanus]|nr:hypothetical protein BDR03DRAFT_1019390 [Suillus americanus]
MAPETWIKTIGDLGDSTPDQYDWACPSLDEYIEELSSMFDEDWANSGPDDTGDQGLVYDLGWRSTAPKVHADSTSSGLEEDNQTYDLGWGPTAPEIHMDGTSSGLEDDEPGYDLGWGRFSSDEQPMDEDSSDSEDEESPAYHLNVIDLTDDNGPASQRHNVIDLTWSSPGPMDLDRDKSPSGGTEHHTTSSTGRFMFHYNHPTVAVANDPSSPAEHLAFQANHRMKTIGHDLKESNSPLIGQHH